MQFVRSSNGPWGFFDPAGSYLPGADWTDQWFFKGHNYAFQLVGISIFVLIIGSLFVCRKYYAKTVNWQWFRISIGIYQIITYFLTYAIWVTYLAVVLKTQWIWGPVGPSQIRGLSEVIPLHLCSLHQLLSGFVLFFPSRKFFEIVAPSAIVLPILAIITPVNGYWSLNNFFYYNYFILHTLIIFAYLYVYKYGLVGKPYSGLLFKWQLLWLTLFSIIAVIWDWIFKTNQLFVGPSSGEPWNNGGFNVGGWNTNFIGAKYMWPFAWLPIFFLGIVIISLTHILFFYLPQSFLYDKKTKKLEFVPRGVCNKFHTKEGLTYIIFTFKYIFLSDNKIHYHLNQTNLLKFTDIELLIIRNKNNS
ncbi:MAG: YwaF family protein [Spiroplasma phoeniceum]|nr:MAG: YwaF family protein [Spiroplasma phoeniceum]UZQ32489.1 MAG: YwaF family protein [Spiroplasma phoeniceum]